MYECTRYAAKIINGRWVDIPFQQIKEGDVFRIFERSGDPVTDQEGNAVFTATSDAYINQVAQAYAVNIAAVMQSIKTEI